MGGHQERGAHGLPATQDLDKPGAALGVEAFPGFVEEDDVRVATREGDAQPEELTAAPRQLTEPPLFVRLRAKQRRPSIRANSRRQRHLTAEVPNNRLRPVPQVPDRAGVRTNQTGRDSE